MGPQTGPAGPVPLSRPIAVGPIGQHFDDGAVAVLLRANAGIDPLVGLPGVVLALGHDE